MRTPVALLLTLLLAPVRPAHAAAPDGNVEWAGISHVAWQDRIPSCPVDGESFTARFQTWANDLTSARVGVTIGAVTTWVNASPAGSRGPYDLWEATVPASTPTTRLGYVIELTDGADTDYLSVGGITDGLPGDGGFIVDFATLEHAPIGATRVTGGGAAFRVWAPTRTTAHVRGEFNGWGLGNPMTKVGEHFIARVPNVADRAQYKFFFNNSVWNTDPRGRSLNASSSYNAHVEEPSRYGWITGDVATPPFDELVIYQLHVGTFAGRNDPVPGAAFPARYLDVAARVGHLAELGVNAVMLNPITEFPGDESAGYNPITMWAPEWRYGTPDQFKALVDSLHARGIAVLLDVVWNHLSPTENFLWNYDGSQQWFDTPAAETPWGSQADFDKEAVRDWYAHSALYWLEEYRVDGFRMDATDYMNQAQGASGWALMQRFNDDVDRRWANKLTIAEQLPNDSWVTRPTGLGGAGFDSQYHDAFTDNLRQEILDAAAGDPEMWRIRDIVNGSGQYLSGVNVVNYFQLHDEAWPSSGGQRMVKTIDPAFPHDDPWARGRVKLAQGLVMFAPGIPAFLMGDEWLEDTDFGAGFGNRIDWAKKTSYASQFAYFKRIVELRRTQPALRAGRPHFVYHLDEAGNVIAFRRDAPDGSALVVIANFSNVDRLDYRIGLPHAGNWHELVNSQSLGYGGSGLDNPGVLPSEAIAANGYQQSLALDVPAMGLIVLGRLDPTAAPGPEVPVTLSLSRIAPLPARAGARFEFTLPAAGNVRLELLDVAGRRVATLASGPRPAGTHAVTWNGRGDDGAPLAAGVYLARLASGGTTIGRRLPVVR